MAYSKVILNGTTLMDTTDKTVASDKLLDGYTALKNDGTDVTGTYVPPTCTLQSKTVSPSTSQQTVSPDSGYDGLSSVTVNAMPTGTAGTPSATKGTVANHAISVTPSVTNTTGYITGGTINGTAVSVSASELVSGTLSITSSGTKDVTNYASASVASGSATTPSTTITANPTISVSASGLITASVSGSQSVTPSVSAGYVASGTAGTVSVSGSNTQQLTTQSAQTITPTTTDQTIASGKYLTGNQTIEGIVCTNLTAENIADGVTVKIGTATDDDSVASITGTHSGGGGGYEDVSSQYSSMYVNNVYFVLLDRQNSKVIFSGEINTNNPEAMMGSAPVPLYACFGQTQSIVKCYYQANSTIYNDAEISGEPYLPSASFKSVCTVYCEAIVAGGGTIF